MAEAEAAGPADFAERMLHMLNEAALALMVSVGHRTGLFDTMAAMPPATSAEIAARAGLNERYVREWLAAMSTGKIVDHDGAAGTFSLPADHAAWLTRAAGAGRRPDRGLLPPWRRGSVLGIPEVPGCHG